MNIIVCVKQVPDTVSQIEIGKDGKSIVTDEIKWVMNPYDEFAVEEALLIKEKFGGEVTVISMGPERVNKTIRSALAMGADRGIWITDPAIEGCSAIVTAKALAAVIKDLSFDIVFTGQRGVDEDQGLVGGLLAEFLGIPQISLAVKVEIEANGKSVKVHRPVEGQTEIVESSLPAVITAEKGLNEPRYATMRRIMLANRQPLEEKTLADIGIDASLIENQEGKLRILELNPPVERSAGLIIDKGSSEANAAELVRLLHEDAKVI